MAYIYDIADTWAASGTTFTGIKLSVTDTASASGSLLMDLQVGGVSRFNVTKTGTIRVAEGSYPATTNLFGTSVSGIGVYSNILTLVANSNQAAWVSPSTLTILPAMAFAWANNGVAGADLLLARDAANTLAQRNSTLAQAFNLYNTYTDASNYERGFMRFVSNVLEIGTQALGTGTQRSTKLMGASLQVEVGATSVFLVQSTGNIIFNNDNSRDIGVAGGVARTVRVGTSVENAGYDQFIEMTAPAAPATNGVRIYAEDNGAGKTRLMARFATGAAVQIAIEP